MFDIRGEKKKKESKREERAGKRSRSLFLAVPPLLPFWTFLAAPFRRFTSAVKPLNF